MILFTITPNGILKNKTKRSKAHTLKTTVWNESKWNKNKSIQWQLGSWIGWVIILQMWPIEATPIKIQVVSYFIPFTKVKQLDWIHKYGTPNHRRKQRRIAPWSSLSNDMFNMTPQTQAKQMWTHRFSSHQKQNH